jgi:hypothetical protein
MEEEHILEGLVLDVANAATTDIWIPESETAPDSQRIRNPPCDPQPFVGL